MNNVKIEEKEAFRFVGFKTQLKGSEEIHAEQFSNQKTEFFKGILHSGKMALLRAISECSYGYGALTTDRSNTFYYAGVKTTQPVIDETVEVLFPAGTYMVLSWKGGLSRLAFDKLEDQAFKEILTKEYGYEYNGNPIAEILLNGNPADAEVEVWIPVNKK